MDFKEWLSGLYSKNEEVIERSNFVQFGEPLDVHRFEIQSQINAQNHKTTQYELSRDKKTPVLRRAHVFVCYLEFHGRNLDLKKDCLILNFYFGNNKFKGSQYKISLKLDPGKQFLSPDKVEWDLVCAKIAPKNLILRVQIGSNAPVGAWRADVETSFINDPYSPRRVHPFHGPLYILFNPYSKDDQVHMPSEAKLDEYIQNPSGKVWMGEVKSVSGRQWIFGQFNEVVLPAICFLLDSRCHLRDLERGDPVRVCRALSALINSLDDHGVLKGKWSEPYSDGRSPWDWSGSAPILHEFVKRNAEVKYGQCWVFSALIVTVCRAIGIPCRSVTNYESAHDTNENLTVEKYFDEEGNELGPRDHPDIGSDSVWNFHVWNDVWMSRPDLPHGYGGWQAIDATPQEKSEGIYQCGPSPLLAIKRGEVHLGFDTRFIFSEVNADMCHFSRDASSKWGFVRTSLKTDEVGKRLLTQTPNYMSHESETDFTDITKDYKFMEGTTEERLSLFNAVRRTEKAQIHYDISPNNKALNLQFHLEEIKSVRFGSPYKGRIFLKNVSNEPRTLNCLVSSSSIYYTGIKAHQVSVAKGIFTLQPGQKETLVLTVEPEAYINKLVEYSMVKIYGLIRVKETNQTWSDETHFTMKKPKLILQSVGWLRVGQKGRFRISFRNPLHLPLTQCKIRLGAAGIIEEVEEFLDNNVGPNTAFSQIFVVGLKASGSGSLIASFTSKEMMDVNGSMDVVVQ